MNSLESPWGSDCASALLGSQYHGALTLMAEPLECACNVHHQGGCSKDTDLGHTESMGGPGTPSAGFSQSRAAYGNGQSVVERALL